MWNKHLYLEKYLNTTYQDILFAGGILFTEYFF